MPSLINRMIRAARLDPSLYEEVEADKSSLMQATVVVVLSSLAVGIALIGQAPLSIVILQTVAALAGWYIWAYIIYFVGAKLFPEPQTHADHGQLLRTLGFAASPGIIRIIGVIPPIFWIACSVASIWMLVAMVIAVRQALDYKSTWRAVLVCLLGFPINALIWALINAILR